ncbi:MAG: rhomboid family intramembrane serine protease [Bacteroidales bacterium]|nr:rhomboid family intramembrane serine protease [Bacteroidales bacterium]MCF8344676.1 rhomboid family intramembrane serine protease [Bacteroidales bacterium]MCF8351478.1 rhomboid family intramembrane serine protease [Bacteroidales bacterium]MCF8375699.1 rhomboid family intramembrane serine protease [Bacteroidales bacterium]MCF8400299.1 rhomboid family intramembrane serine protease [Bacteroidales bacterium]
MVNYIILGITTIVSIWAFSRPDIFDWLKFSPYAIKHSRQGWRFFSYALIHANWPHLLINMFVLFFFGRFIENVFVQLFGGKGILFFILLYAGGVLFSVLFEYRKNLNNYYYGAVGASGAVSAIVFSYILINPLGTIYLYFLPMPAIVFGILYLIYSAYMAKKAGDNVGHSAHFWGSVFGVAYPLILEPRLAGHFFSTLFGVF